MATLTRVGPGSAFKVVLITYFLIGIVLAIVISLVGMAMPAATPMSRFSPTILIIAIPVGYGIVGGIVALIGAALYNLVARLVGGLEVDLG